MGTSVCSVDLSKLDENGLRDIAISQILQQGKEPVSVFSVKNHDEARAQAERLANSRLSKISDKAIEEQNNFNSHYWDWLGVKLTIKCLLGMDDGYGGSCMGGGLRQKAINTQSHIKTHSQLDHQNLPRPANDTMPFYEKVDRWWFGVPSDGLSQDDIKKLSRLVFGNRTAKQAIFAAMPENEKRNIAIYEANIDSKKYNALPNEEGNYDGLEISSYEIPSVYKKLVQMFLSGEKELTKNETQKFLETIKALETIAAFSTKQQEGSANAKKEDVDLFDLSGDGLLNRGDISAMQLFIKFAQDKETLEKIKNASPEDWNSIKKLKEISGVSKDKEAKNLFDLNGDGYVNEKDYQLHKEIFSKPYSFDLNGDNFVDNKDIEIIEEYFRATLKKAKEDKTYRKNTEEIVGSEEQMRILQKCVQEW